MTHIRSLQCTIRICQVCKKYVEDEIHFLIKCDQYNTLRQPMLDLCVDLRPQFHFYSDQEKFIFLMTNPKLVGNVSKYIQLAMEERDAYLETSYVIDELLNKVCTLVP